MVPVLLTRSTVEDEEGVILGVGDAHLVRHDLADVLLGGKMHRLSKGNTVKRKLSHTGKKGLQNGKKLEFSIQQEGVCSLLGRVVFSS